MRSGRVAGSLPGAVRLCISSDSCPSPPAMRLRDSNRGETVQLHPIVTDQLLPFHGIGHDLE
jgi:hypothetical protein